VKREPTKTPPPIRDFLVLMSPMERTIQSMAFYLGMQVMCELQPDYRKALETQHARQNSNGTGAPTAGLSPADQVERQQQIVATSLLEAEQYVIADISMVVREVLNRTPVANKAKIGELVETTDFKAEPLKTAELCVWTGKETKEPVRVTLCFPSSPLSLSSSSETSKSFVVDREISAKLKHFYFFTHFNAIAMQVIRTHLQKDNIRKFYSPLTPRAQLEVFLGEKVLDRLLDDYSKARDRVVQLLTK